MEQLEFDCKAHMVDNVKRGCAWPIRIAVVAVFGLAVLGIISYLRFGSVSGGLAFVAGERIIFDSKAKSFGQIDQDGQKIVSFRLTNFLDRPVRVLGAKTQCTCLVADRLPMTIGILETANLTVIVRKGSTTGWIQENIRFYTDCAEYSQIMVSLSGRIIDRSRSTSNDAHD